MSLVTRALHRNSESRSGDSYRRCRDLWQRAAAYRQHAIPCVMKDTQLEQLTLRSILHRPRASNMPSRSSTLHQGVSVVNLLAFRGVTIPHRLVPHGLAAAPRRRRKPRLGRHRGPRRTQQAQKPRCCWPHTWMAAGL